MNRSDERKIEISVVIPSYKSGEGLYNCLKSVFNQTIDIPFQVIVVDSSPEDITAEVKERFPQVEVIHLKRRTLPGLARTVGAKSAKGKYVFFIDTDCIAHKDWLKLLYEKLQQGVFAAGGGVENGTPDSYVGTAEYLLEFNEMNPKAKAGTTGALPSCNLSVSRDVLEKVGYFPDFMKGEDTILCDNIITSGHEIHFIPDAFITHKNRTGFMHFIKNQVALGEGANETRRRTKRHGYFLIKYPVLVVFIPVYRTLIISRRLIKSDIKLFFSFISHYPLIFLGLIAYTWGFIRGPYRSGLSTEKGSRNGTS